MTGVTEEEQGPTSAFEGQVVSITADKLVMKTGNGKEYAHTLARNARLTCDGTPCQAAELKTGSRIRVTTRKKERNSATCVEALDKNTRFAESN